MRSKGNRFSYFIIQPILASLTTQLTLIPTALAIPVITSVSNTDIRNNLYSILIIYNKIPKGNRRMISNGSVYLTAFYQD